MSYCPVMPAIRYRDAPAMIDFLCRAFGFERKAVYDGPDGTVAHAELTLGDAMIMLGSATQTPYGRLVEPAEPGRPVTMGLYVVVGNVDAHHDRAIAEGATLEIPLTDQSYGGRDYTCRDPEGQVWTFGTYAP
ncbi:VOC family protein [Propylenella binzhouense]|uniref:Glyoxalase n=1 Tax=Propylenella binzhouense TaxID=2555902 RepID=A0A964WT05_9HYPH|nr:VOC family protein [Propylenella binzhouense]MYZ47508.1 glyoxalase [Propylenella binzhouense]